MSGTSVPPDGVGARLAAAVVGAGPPDADAEQAALTAFRAARDAGALDARPRPGDDWRPRRRPARWSLRAVVGTLVASVAVGGVAVAGIGTVSSPDDPGERGRPGRTGAPSASASAGPSTGPAGPGAAAPGEAGTDPAGTAAASSVPAGSVPAGSASGAATPAATGPVEAPSGQPRDRLSEKAAGTAGTADPSRPGQAEDQQARCKSYEAGHGLNRSERAAEGCETPTATAESDTAGSGKAHGKP
ncbi:hypothetical protein [Streptomyces sp. SGAir0957]